MQELMNYEILQTGADYVFRDYDFASKHGLSLKDYKSVYKDVISVGDGSDEGAVAELLFMIFNSNKRPEKYTGRSMSVSDIVIINNKYFYCDDFGFKALDIELKM